LNINSCNSDTISGHGSLEAQFGLQGLILPCGEPCIYPPLEAWNEMRLLKAHGVFLAGQESQRWHTRTEPSFGAGLSCQVAGAGNGGLRRSRVLHDSIELTAKTSGLLSYLLACLLTKRRYDFGKLKRSKQTVIVFKVNDDVIIRGQ